ncbi:hypothetical protein [Actinokineospora pegani]|uniref:hypothetical protein n=1 Tax=Actinokineospora pegani TaxID=2654637 RepID=UPI0012EA6AE6|nr:hypothetical protein [Actinokineospora pegani]
MGKLPLLGSLLAAALVLGGCSSGPPDQAAENPPVPEPSLPASVPPAPVSAADVELPLAPYVQLAAGNEGVLTKASALLVTKCMRDKGFSHTPGGGGGQAGSSAPLPDYGLNDSDQARKSGYSRPGVVSGDELARAGAMPDFDQQVREHGEAWMKALYGFTSVGTPSDGTGCFDTAFVRVPEYDKLDKELPGKLLHQSDQLTRADSRVVGVTGDWSACMAESGFRYRSPAEPARQQWPKPVGSQEITTAVTDVACKQRTNLPGTWLAVQAGYQQTLLDRNAPALEELKNAWRLVVEEAERVVANGG